MPIFETAIQQVTGSVGTIASDHLEHRDTSPPPPTARWARSPPGNVLKDVVIQNTGANTMYVGFGSISATSTTGMEVKRRRRGGLLRLHVTSTANNATGDIWAQTGVVGQTTSCVVGLASIPNAVV